MQLLPGVLQPLKAESVCIVSGSQHPVCSLHVVALQSEPAAMLRWRQLQ